MIEVRVGIAFDVRASRLFSAVLAVTFHAPKQLALICTLWRMVAQLKGAKHLEASHDIRI